MLRGISVHVYKLFRAMSQGPYRKKIKIDWLESFLTEVLNESLLNKENSHIELSAIWTLTHTDPSIFLFFIFFLKYKKTVKNVRK